MKRIIYLFCALALPITTLFSQNVNTSIEKRKVLVEEYTGIGCGNCPDGQALLSNLMKIQPSVYALAIHAGYYADASGNKPDFRTEDGDSIHNEFGIEGYPSATINRGIIEENELVAYRNLWTKMIKDVTKEDAEVNLHLSSSYDANTDTLYITVEGYYTKDIASDIVTLNVAIAQDYIIGIQAGGGDNYSHNHMLRDYVTPTWGDTLDTPVVGEYFTKTYKYALPEKIVETPMLAENIEVFAFVTEDKRKVLNVAAEKPMYKNMDIKLNAEIEAKHAAIATRFAGNDFDLMIENLSNVDITSANFNLILNGDTQNIVWTGTALPYSVSNITITADDYTLENSNTYKIELISVNNTDLEEVSSFEGSFLKPVSTSGLLTIDITTDKSADENTYKLKDIEGNLVQEFGPFAAGESKLNSFTVNVPADGLYMFEITDSWNDGLLNGRGKLKIVDAKGMLVAQDFEITNTGLRHYFYAQTATNSEMVDENESNMIVFSNNANIYVQLPQLNSNATLSVVSVIGKTLYSKNVNMNQNTMEISSANLNTGVYLIVLNDGNAIYTQKIIL